MDAKNRITRFAMVISLLAVVWGASIGCTLQKPTATPPAATAPTLYERIGGINKIALLVDDVIERSYVDPVFEANPSIHAAHQGFPKEVYKFNATALACQVFGGPQVYTGRSLKEAHQHLNVTEKEWQALMRIFHDSMTSFHIPEKEQAEVMAIIKSTKGDIVVPAAQ